ncbi:DUF4340 domain-containing protein [Geminicoccus roseus]|uniref:DUF4340 domain-containing protein n=1 Tax=Geminicoccus roseus TaxID=404900 RepID=UPI0003F87981|nr:DUF4340 domain-containing protein [Geminicoccus roseus]
MQPRNFLMLAGIAGVSVILATAALVMQDRPLVSTSLDQPLAPTLAPRINDVVRIDVSGPDGAASLERKEDAGWVVAQKNGFAADEQAIVGLLRKLGTLRIVEAKTALPERLPRLELGDPAAPDSRSRRILLQDAAGEVVADLVVGKRAFGVFGPGRTGTYVRLADDNQAWLTDAEITLPTSAAEWISSEVIDIAPERVKLVSLEPQDGVLVTTSRAGPEATQFDLAGVPAKEAADQAKLEELSQVLSQLTLLDVRPAQEVAFPDVPERVRVETFDGLTVVLTWISLPDASWLRVGSVTADSTASAEVKEEAARLAARTDGWVFHVGGYVTEQLGQTLDDLLVKPEES